MKKSQSIGLGIVLLLLAVLVIAGGLLHFKVKPTLEQQLAEEMTTYFTAQGVALQKPISVSVNPFTRILTIDPIAIAEKKDIGLLKGQIEQTEVLLTWQALLAFSPASSVLEKQDIIPLAEYSRSPGMKIEMTIGTLTCGSLNASNISIREKDLFALLTSAQEKNLPVSIQEGTAENLALTFKENGSDATFTIGRIRTSDMTPERVGSLTLENITSTENGTKNLSIGKMSQEGIRIISDEERAALLKKLNEGDQEAQAEALIALLIGKDALVNKTSMEDLTISVEKNPLKIGQITLQGTREPQENLLSVSDIAIPAKILEEQAEQRLPLPPMLFLDFSLGATQTTTSTYTFAATFGIKELFHLDCSLAADIDSLDKVSEKLKTCPLHDFHFTLKDASALARLSLFLAPDGSGKQYLLKELELDDNASQIEKNITQKVVSFVEHPGTITIATKKNEKFRVPQILEMSEQDAMNHLVLTVQPGEEDLDVQIKRILQEK